MTGPGGLLEPPDGSGRSGWQQGVVSPSSRDLSTCGGAAAWGGGCGNPGKGLDNRRPRGFSDRKIPAQGHCAGVEESRKVRAEGSAKAGGLRQVVQVLFTSEQRPLKASTHRSPVNPLTSGGWRPTLAPSPADCPRGPAGGTGPCGFWCPAAWVQSQAGLSLPPSGSGTKR